MSLPLLSLLCLATTASWKAERLDPSSYLKYQSLAQAIDFVAQAEQGGDPQRHLSLALPLQPAPTPASSAGKDG